MLCWLELPNFFWSNNVRVSYCGTDSLKCFFINLFVLTVPSDILGESFSSMAITRFPCTIIVMEIFITRSVTISLTLNVYKPMLWSQNKIFFLPCFSCGRKMHRSHIKVTSWAMMEESLPGHHTCKMLCSSGFPWIQHLSVHLEGMVLRQCDSVHFLPNISCLTSHCAWKGRQQSLQKAAVYLGAL